MQTKKENVQLGFLCALHTAVMWGLVPIAMKFIITEVDPGTLIHFRFTFAFVGLTLYLLFSKKLPQLSHFKEKKILILLGIASLGLFGNFIGFASGVQYLSPTASQVVAQCGILIFMISSVFVFKERLRPSQIIGLSILLIGLLLFFNRHLLDLFTHFSDYGLGVWLTILASVSWAIYALAQKALLLNNISSNQILWTVYCLCTLASFPFAHFSLFLNLNFWQWIALLFCGLNTLIAYGTLVLAMEYWRATEVSAITTLTPLFSLLFADLFALWLPRYFEMQELDLIGYFGAVTVVFGALTATIGHKIWRSKKVLI